jgi:transcriptional regulator with XRE-family HTH domain
VPDSSRSAFAVVGERIRLARVERNLTQEDVAHAAGMNLSYYGKLERGQNNPTLDTLIRVADVIGAPLPDLVTDLATAQLPARAAWPRRGPR